MNFVRIGKHVVNLERVTWIEVDPGEEAEPVIRFHFGPEDAIGLFQKFLNGEENEEYSLVKRWLESIPVIQSKGEQQS